MQAQKLILACFVAAASLASAGAFPVSASTLVMVKQLITKNTTIVLVKHGKRERTGEEGTPYIYLPPQRGEASLNLLAKVSLGRLACAKDNQPYITPLVYWKRH
jgi:hypothetical protein